MVTGTDMGMGTLGVTDTGVAGTPAIVITHIMAIMDVMDTTSSMPDLFHVTGMYTPASIDLLTSSGRPMGQQDRIGTSRDPGREYISDRSKTCTNDRKIRAGIQGHPVINGRGNASTRTPNNDVKVRPGIQRHPVIQDKGKT